MSVPAWKARLQKASFRGVEFLWRAQDASEGRRTEVHQYPGRDNPWVEDLGSQAGVYRIDVFLVGPEYMSARDQLREALNKAGPGDLVHPTLGKLRVAVTRADLHEDTAEQGMARFDVEFTQTTEPDAPSARTDTPAQTQGAAKVAADVAEEEAAFSLDLDQVADYARQAAGLLGGNLVLSVLARVRQYAPIGAVFSITASAYEIIAGAGAFIRDPGSWTHQLRGMVGNFGTSLAGVFGPYPSHRDAPSAARTAAQAQARAAVQGIGEYGARLTPTNPDALRQAQAQVSQGQGIPAAIGAGLSLTVPDINLVVAPGVSPGPQTEAMTRAAIGVASYARRLALVEEARLSALSVFESAADAQAVRDDLTGRLALEAEAGSDDVFEAFTALRIAVWNDLTARSADLARAAVYTPAETQPAIVLAWQIYGDATRWEELCRRNDIAHPLFVPGGEPLQVLSQ
jgi:hypothetical protein